MHELTLIDVHKKYKDKIAVQGVDVCLHYGVYGILGENGAGKTTLMRIICNILKPTQGMILCDGMNIDQMGGEYRKLLGYLPQDFGYYQEFSAYRFMHYIAALKALPAEYAGNKIEELLELVDLVDVKDRKLKTYSGGMLRRIGIAQALLNDPDILILDEPTAGLDPKERVRFRNIISSLGKNRIVLLSTHIVPDVEYIADQIIIMKSGRIIHMGTQEEMAQAAKDSVWRCIVKEDKMEELTHKYIISNLRNYGDQIDLRIISNEKPTPDASRQEAVLEDVYLYYAQKGEKM